MLVEVEVLENFRLAEEQYLLVTRVPQEFRQAQPGQFVMLKTHLDADPLLPRPFTVSLIAGGEMEIMYRVVGKTTKAMSKLRSGNRVFIKGPYGKGFKLEGNKILLVGGGIGIASLRYLSWVAHSQGKEQIILYGEKSESRAVSLHNLFPPGIETHLILEEKGNLVTDFLPEIVSQFQPDAVYACGPRSMLKKVSRKVSGNLQISLEEVMACGEGNCYGCVIRTREGYVRVCREGPVFRKGEIEWI